jgi:hypothetical protein
VPKIWLILLQGEFGKMLLEVLTPVLLVASQGAQLLAGFAGDGQKFFVVRQVSLFPEMSRDFDNVPMRRH